MVGWTILLNAVLLPGIRLPAEKRALQRMEE